MSDVQWGLAGPGFDAMQVLQAAGQTYPQRQMREQQQYARQRDEQDDALKLMQIRSKQEFEKHQADAKQLGEFALLADTPEKWDAYARQYVQMGHPEAAQYIGKFSPEARASLIAVAGKASEFLSQQEPRFTSIPEGGTLVNTRDPSAVAAYQGRQAPTGPVSVASPEQYQQLAPGTPYIAPDGSHRVKGGAAPQGAATFP